MSFLQASRGSNGLGAGLFLAGAAAGSFARAQQLRGEPVWPAENGLHVVVYKFKDTVSNATAKRP